MNDRIKVDFPLSSESSTDLCSQQRTDMSCPKATKKDKNVGFYQNLLSQGFHFHVPIQNMLFEFFENAFIATPNIIMQGDIFFMIS